MSERRTFWQFVKDSFDLVLHPFESAKKELHKRQLAEHQRKMLTDPAYVAEVLDPTPKESRQVQSGGLGNILGGFVTIVVGVGLLPEIAKQVGNATMAGNVTSSTMTYGAVLSIVPWVFGAAVCIMGIAGVIKGLRMMGVI